MAIQYIDRHTGKTITEAPPAEGMLKFLYDNPLGKLTLLPLVKRKFVSALYGGRMDKPGSASKIQSFVDQLGIDMTESIKRVDEFTSFNDFFYRKLKPSARPIGDGIISPGDGRLLAFEHVDQVNDFFVKGRRFTLKEFLADQALADKYADGSMLILRLAPNDYHRYHFPWSGKATRSKLIKGSYYSVSPYALASNFTKVFCENKREYCTLQTANKGDILLAPVGATMVGSILSTYTPDSPLQKGDEMGYFAFGGSTVVILFEKDTIKIDDDLLKTTSAGKETYVKMGERIGV